MTVTGLLLAAGRGTRFDAHGDRDKLLADLAGTPVAVQSARRLLAATGRALAVTRPGSAALERLLSAEGLAVVECPDAGLGMGHSLARGAVELARASPAAAVLVALADMPFVASSTYASVLAAAAGQPPDVIVAPRHQGARGHPVLFGAAHLPALAASTGDRGASALLQSHPVTWVDVDDAGILRDIDRPSDLDPAGGAAPHR